MGDTTRIPSFCTQCRSRCGCDAIVENGRLLEIQPRPEHPSGERLCPKGRAATELVYHPDRLTRPMRRTSPKGAAEPSWEPISWDEALDEIACRMARIRDAHGPEQVAFGVTTPSGTHISDGIAWIERFIRAYGSPNTVYSTEICNWHKDFASRFTYGADIGTPDFAHADLILLWGHNPAATWLARSGEVLKAMKRGAKLMVVDPRPTQYARRADAWLRVRPGTDQALALGLANLLIESGRFDAAFARRWTNAALLVRRDTGRLLRESDLRDEGRADVFFAASGDGLIAYDAAAGGWIDDPENAALIAERAIEAPAGPIACDSALRLFAEAAAEYPPERVAEMTGVQPEDLARAADLIASGGKVAYYAWNGIGQSVTATQTDRALSILYALTGCYGAEGGNVPGGAAAFNDISGQDLLSETQRAKALGLAERPLGPGRNGWVVGRDVYRAVLERKPYPVRMLFSFGGNPLSAQPDTEAAIAAMKALEFHVHVDFFLNASADYADIVLPAATSWEREGLRNGFDASLEGLRRVQLRPAAIAPIGEARSDVDIVMALSERLGLSERMFDDDVNKGHAHMLAPSGVSLDALRADPAGVTLPGQVRLRAYETDGFKTPSKRIEIYSEQLLEAGQAPVPSLDPADLLESPGEAFPLRLGCAKTLTYCHSQGRNLPSLRRLTPDPVLEIAPDAAAARDVSDGDWVRITTDVASFIARAKLTAQLAPDAVFAQHGWTIRDFDEAGEEGAANMNRAVSTTRADPVSGSIPLRSYWCEVRKI